MLLFIDYVTPASAAWDSGIHFGPQPQLSEVHIIFLTFKPSNSDPDLYFSPITPNSIMPAGRCVLYTN